MSRMTRNEKLQLIRGVWSGSIPLRVLLPKQGVILIWSNDEDGTSFFVDGKKVSRSDYYRECKVDEGNPPEFEYSDEEDRTLAEEVARQKSARRT